jgi:hypothetical protein
VRAPRAGDLGWIVHRHGAIYAREYGFDDSFEGEVAAILAKFAARRDAAHEELLGVSCVQRRQRREE